MRNERNIVIDWSDVKQAFMDVVAESKPYPGLPSQPMARRMAGYARNPYLDDAWEGGKPSQTLEWLRNGYYAPEFAHSAEYVQIAMKRKPNWNDEDGDVDSSRLLGGYDEFFLATEQRESKPGLRVLFEFAFACGVQQKVIQEYGAWVAGLLGALEASGYDLTVDAWIPLDDLYVNDRGTRSNVLMRVKRENEVSDFTEWSALFGPTGYRQLGFLAKARGGDKIGKPTNGSFGTTLSGRNWGLEYDKESSTVKITVAQRGGYGYREGSTFPHQDLTEKAIKAGLLPEGARSAEITA